VHRQWCLCTPSLITAVQAVVPVHRQWCLCTPSLITAVQAVEPLIAQGRHHVLKAVHPSGLSAHRVGLCPSFNICNPDLKHRHLSPASLGPLPSGVTETPASLPCELGSPPFWCDSRIDATFKVRWWPILLEEEGNGGGGGGGGIMFWARRANHSTAAIRQKPKYNSRYTMLELYSQCLYVGGR